MLRAHVTEGGKRVLYQEGARDRDDRSRARSSSATPATARAAGRHRSCSAARSAARGGVRATSDFAFELRRPGARPQDRPQPTGSEPADPGLKPSAEEDAMPMNKAAPRVHPRRHEHRAGPRRPAIPSGIQQKILASDLDETPQDGQPHAAAARSSPAPTPPRRSCTTIGRRSTSSPATSSSATTGAARAAKPFEAPTYACRPPGVYHGPFKSEQRLPAVRDSLLRREQRSSEVKAARMEP